MNWDDENHKLALRIATTTTWGFDQALQALEAGGEAREGALALLRSGERRRRVLEKVAELRGESRRRRFGFF